MPIDIPTLVKRLRMRALDDRAKLKDEISDIAQGLWEPQQGTILPLAANAKRQRAYNRLVRQMQTIGPRVMEAKLNAILGSVTWGMNDDELDDRLTTLDLPGLARRAAMDYVTHGITALAATTPEGATPRISRLGGYLEPYLNPDDRDEITGLFQAWQLGSSGPRRSDPGTTNAFNDQAERHRQLGNVAGGSWTVRIYDFETDTMTEWVGLRNPYEIGRTPTREETDVVMPRVLVRELSIDGLPLGEIERAAPQIKALWATEARLLLAEELSAFGMLTVTGASLPDGFAVGPGELLELPAGATAAWMMPGNLEELRMQKAGRQERLREDLSLPGGFLGNDSPSGEAFREANVRFRQNTERYATELSAVLTDAVMDFGEVVGLGETPEVVINPSKAYDEPARVQSILSQYAAGVIPLGVAVNELRVFLPSWDDESANAWVEEQSALVRPEDLVFPGGDESA